MDHREILDAHLQLREFSCFQMAPELALKLAGLLGRNDYPFQNEKAWDGKGCEPYHQVRRVGEYQVTFTIETYQHPYDGTVEKLE